MSTDLKSSSAEVAAERERSSAVTALWLCLVFLCSSLAFVALALAAPLALALSAATRRFSSAARRGRWRLVEAA
jgi:hypothetical protein